MNKVIDLEKLNSVTDLKSSDLVAIEGGGFWGDIFYAGAATVHFLAYMVVDAHNNPIRPSEYR